MDNQSIQNIGINQGAGSSLTVGKDLTININSSSPAGTSTSVSTTPFRFNVSTPTRHFQGRRKTIEDVRDYFTNLSSQTDHCWERIIAIVGLGGMGKTETAYKFAADHKEIFPNVAWINSETEQSCLTSFMDLGKQLGVVPMDMKIADADLNLVKKVYREIDGRDCGRVLLIFDNAIQLYSNGTEFGILDYLPTEDLLNRRFPYILLTTQTDYWERGINKFRVNELAEEESLDFFRSIFRVKAPECDEEFKSLHKILEGYPLVMNLVAAQIDYIPNEDSIHRLKQQISNYIENLAKQQDKILSQKMSRAWPNSYNKTLSNVWQLTFERIQQEDYGRDALELLQLMSFLYVPIHSSHVLKLIVSKLVSHHPPTKKLEFQLKEYLRVLERFYAVRILKNFQDDEMGFKCEFGIHRLLQLVVRQQIQSSEVVEQVLFYCSRKYNDAHGVNVTALEEAIHRIQFSLHALPYVGILACHGVRTACNIVKTREPQTKAAATIWRLYNLERGLTTLNENAIQVVRELIGLTTSEEQLQDRKSFSDILIYLLAGHKYFKYTREDGTEVPDYFHLARLGVSEYKVFTRKCSYKFNDKFKDVFNWKRCPSCEYNYGKHDQEMADDVLSLATAQILSKLCIREDWQNRTFTDDDIAGLWFTMFTRLKYYQSKWDCWPRFWGHFWRDMYKTFHSPDAPQSRIAALRTCLWNRGLAVELVHVFGRFIEFHTYDSAPWVLVLMDVCMEGMDSRDDRVQEVLSSFCQMATTIYTKFASCPHYNYDDYYDDDQCNWECFEVELCSVWMKLLLTGDNPPSDELVNSLTRLKFLNSVGRNLDNRDHHLLRRPLAYTPHEYRSRFFDQFIQRFSTSDIKGIQSLVVSCNRFLWRTLW